MHTQLTDIVSPAFCDIGATAKECLRASPYHVFAGVLCDCQRGVLFLRGRVSSFHHKQVAQEAVARVHGVTQVVNEIEVDRTENPSHRRWNLPLDAK